MSELIVKTVMFCVNKEIEGKGREKEKGTREENTK